MKKTITKPEVKVMKLQKMNVIATSGDTPSGSKRASVNTATVILNDYSNTGNQGTW